MTVLSDETEIESMTPDEMRAEIERLNRINSVLMDRVEHSMDLQGDAFSIFQTAVVLQDKAKRSAQQLEGALVDLDNVRSQLHSAIEVLDEGFAMFDADDRLILCNDRYRRIWGGDGPTLGATFMELARTLMESSALPQAKNDPEAWLAERLERHRNPHEPVVIRSGDDCWLQVSERRTADGGIVGLYTDITEVKRREARRREQELAEKSILLQATLENLDQGVAVLNGKGQLEIWNRRFLELLELSGNQLENPHLPGLEDQPDPSLPFSAEFTTPCNRVLDVRVNPMPHGRQVATYTDITDRQTKEQQLVQAVDRLTQVNTELERFAYVASHDLREPLRTIVSFTQLLQRTLTLDEEAQQYINLVVGAGKRMNNLIAGLLDYSRVSGQSSSFRSCNMDHIRSLAMDNLRGSIEQSGASIHAASLPMVNGDPVQLLQLLQNLIGNAIKYSRPDSKPEIWIDAHADDEQTWRISVTDNGIGVQDNGHDIYELFRRLHHKSEYPGAGIGLAVCRRIVQHHGGRLWHEPAETGGTRFLFTLGPVDNFPHPQLD